MNAAIIQVLTNAVPDGLPADLVGIVANRVQGVQVGTALRKVGVVQPRRRLWQRFVATGEASLERCVWRRHEGPEKILETTSGEQQVGPEGRRLLAGGVRPALCQR